MPSTSSSPRRRTTITAPFITFEGGEGAGKSTQIKRLAARLGAAGIDTLVTREPGGSPKAERIREVLLSGRAKPFGALAEAVLFSAARIDHVDTVIAPALARGTWVLCDRFIDSTRAYQGVSGEVDPREIRTLERVVVGELRPTMTFILDVPPDVGLERAASRQGDGKGRDRFEAEGLAFHERLRSIFLEIAAAEPERCVVIDAQDDEEAVAERIWKHVSGHLPVRPPQRRKRSRRAAV
jgi:dTMP kinase